MASHPLSLRLSADVKARLAQAAKAEARSLSYVAQKALVSYLDARDAKHEVIRQALAEFEQETHVISGEAVSLWVDSWGTENELPPPAPDTRRTAKVS